MHLDASAVQGNRFEFHPNDLVGLERSNTRSSTPALVQRFMRVDSVPVAESLRQPAPFAAVLGNVKDRVKHIQVDELTLARCRGKQSGSVRTAQV